jgi:hypothetical protein
MLVFIDESGLPHPKDDATHPVLLAVCLKEANMRLLERRLFSLRRTHLAELTLTREEQEGKAVEFLSRRAVTKIVAKREYVESLFEFLRELDLSVFAIVMDRPTQVPWVGTETLSTQYRWLLERVERHMENTYPNYFAVPVFDNRAPSQDRMFSQSYTGYMALNQYGKSMTHIMPSPLFADSALTPGIQVADLFAYALRMNEEQELFKTAQKDPYFSALRRYANIVKSKTVDYEDEDGTMQWGIRHMDASKFDYEPPSRKSQSEAADA